MSVGRAFGAPFRDSRWFQKIALAVLLLFVPVVSASVGGWGMAYVQRSAEGRDAELPEWNDFGSYWVKGLAFGIASAIYYLPTYLIIAAVGVPGILLGAAQMGSGSGGSLAGISSALSAMGAGILAAGAYALAVSYFVQAARTHYAIRGTFSAAFDFKGIFAAVKTNPSGYFVAWIMQILAVWGAALVGLAIGMALGWIPCAGLIVIPIAGGIGVSLGLGANALFGQYAQVAYVNGSTGRTWSSSTYPADSSARHTPAQAYAGSGSVEGRSVIAAAVGSARADNGEAVTSRFSAVATLPPITAPIPSASNCDQGADVTGSLERVGEFTAASTASGKPSTAGPIQEAVILETAASSREGKSVGGTESHFGHSSADAPSDAAEFEPQGSSQLKALAVADARQQLLAETESQLADNSELAVSSRVPGKAARIAETPGMSAPTRGPEMVAKFDSTPETVPEQEPSAGVGCAGPQAGLESADPTDHDAQSAAPLRLRKSTGPGRAAEAWSLPPTSRVTVGRDSGCYVLLADDGKVSRKHAAIDLRSGFATIADLRSGNGTYLNGIRIGEQEERLSAGDQVRCGATVLIVEIVPNQ